MAGEIALQWFGGIVSPNNEHKDFSLSGEALAYYAISWLTNSESEENPIYITKSNGKDMTTLLKMTENIISRKVLQYAICQIYLPKT